MISYEYIVRFIISWLIQSVTVCIRARLLVAGLVFTIRPRTGACIIVYIAHCVQVRLIQVVSEAVVTASAINSYSCMHCDAFHSLLFFFFFSTKNSSCEWNCSWQRLRTLCWSR